LILIIEEKTYEPLYFIFTVYWLFLLTMLILINVIYIL
jgi:hypothetical protein